MIFRFNLPLVLQSSGVILGQSSENRWLEIYSFICSGTKYIWNILSSCIANNLRESSIMEHENSYNLEERDRLDPH